jgi:uncharacterized protein (TIGR02757 family)
MEDRQSLRLFLDERVAFYNTPAFIPSDPISIPHRFSKKQDIEIAGFFAATLAWGRRSTIIANCTRLMRWMHEAPHDFILHHRPEDLKPMLGFAHRTFNATDLLFFVERLQQHYRQHESLEDAFVLGPALDTDDIGPALIHFHNYFFSGEHPARTRKHLSTPARGSACKRLCMFLRWMVRKDDAGVDFGIWTKMSPAQLVVPLDVHVARVAHRLGLIREEKANWRSALELTRTLRQWRSEDPSVYDFALFGLGAEERF